MVKLKAQRFPKLMFILVISIFLMIVISINAGYLAIPVVDVFQTLIGQGTAANTLTIFDFRLPRIIMAILVGMGIAVSGAILQGLSKNPLADPGILGINAGAGFAVVLYMFFVQGSIFFNSLLYVFLMPFIAMMGALLAAACIYSLAWKKGSVTPTRMLLVGIGINAAFGAGITIFQMKMEPINFMKAVVWLSGSIWGSTWAFVWALLPWLVVLIPLAIYKSRVLDIMALSDATSIAVGMDLNKERRQLLLLSVILAGACVAVGGGITFLGLIAPHIARRLVGAANRFVIPLSAVLGALLILIADTLGRIIMAPVELPVGIILSIIGAPYFIYLLLKN